MAVRECTSGSRSVSCQTSHVWHHRFLANLGLFAQSKHYIKKFFVLIFRLTSQYCNQNLTGGANGGVHSTDVTNASRTMLMNIVTLKWDSTLLSFFNIPPEILPQIRSSSEIYGYIQDELLQGVPISGVCSPLLLILTILLSVT